MKLRIDTSYMVDATLRYIQCSTWNTVCILTISYIYYIIFIVHFIRTGVFTYKNQQASFVWLTYIKKQV